MTGGSEVLHKDQPTLVGPKALAIGVFAIAILTGDAALADDDHAEIALGLYEGLNGGGRAAFEAVLADDWIVHGTSPSLPSMGFDDWFTGVSNFVPSMGDSSFTVEAVHVAGDFVTVRGTVDGTHMGPIFGIEATGAPIELAAIDIHRIEDGRIAESWHVEDYLTLLTQIGGVGTE